MTKDVTESTAKAPKLAGGSIDERLNRAAANAQERLIILQDCSGSMGETFDGEPGRFVTKLDCAKTAIEHFLAVCDRRLSAVGLIAFESGVHALCEPTQNYALLRQHVSMLAPMGCTNMAGGLCEAAGFNPTRLILVSDGVADSPQAVLKQAQACAVLGLPIDCIFIGEPQESGATLLKRVASLTGGHFFTVNDMTSYVTALGKLELRARLQLEHKA